MKPLFCIFCILFSCVMYGQEFQPYQGKDRPVVGLVLSGGAAHGMAHIGVIRMLEELEIPIDYIVGTSMGALVGGMKAMGYSSYDIEAIVQNMDWNQVINNEIRLHEVAPAEKYYHNKFPLFLEITNNGIELPIGAINSYNLDMTLNRLYNPAYQITDFDSLPIPFTCNTTNIANLTNVEMHSGSLTKAMRKTMSIPSLFTPVRSGDGVYVDGGVISNFPVDHAKRLGVDIVLGSYVGAELRTADDINSMDDILIQIGFFQSLDEFMTYENMVDVLFLPEVKGISSLAFDNEDFYIEEGYKSALKQKDKLIALRDSFNLKPNKTEKLEPLTSIMIDEILIEGVSEESEDFIKEKLHIDEGSYVEIEKIEELLMNIYSTKIFQSLNYSLGALPNNRTQLIIEASEKKEANLGVSLNRFNSTGLGIIGIVKLKNYFANLSNVDIIGRLSDYPGIFLRGYKRGNGRFANTLFGLQTKAEIISNPFYSNGDRESIYNLLELELKPYVMLEFGNNFSTSLSYNLFYQKYGNRITANNFRDDFRYSSFFVSWDVIHDSYDNPLIPNRGTKSRMALEYYHDVRFKLSEADTSTIVTSDNVAAHFDISHVVPITEKIIFEYMLAISVDINNAAAPTNIGGEYQDRRNRLPFVGLQESRIQSPTFFYLRGEVRFPIMPNLFLSPVANLYIGEDDDIFYSGGLIARYNLPIGPISLSFGFASKTSEPKGTFAIGHRYIF